jgi:nucleoside-diphosphate-sugar epimerase
MNLDSKRDVVFGAGPVGLGVSEHLARMGHDVVLATRSGRTTLPGTTGAAADLTRAEEVRELARGAAAIYLCASPPYDRWASEFVPMIESVAAGVEGSEAPIVFADNLYAYGPPDAPMTERTAERPSTVKGRVRQQVAARLLALRTSQGPRVAIARASDFYGPRVVSSSIGSRVFEAVARGKGAPVVGNIDVPHSYTYIDDFVRGMVTLGGRREALGEVWHIPSAAPTTREMVAMIAAEYGTASRFMVASRFLVTMMALVNPTMRELKEMLYQFERPFVVDGSRFATAFGVGSTPLQEGIRATVAWLRSQQRTGAPLSAAASTRP